MPPTPRVPRPPRPRRLPNPLAEVFGKPPTNMSEEAERLRTYRLCPFHNTGTVNCTKSKAQDPLGVCSIATENGPVITCPVRFREDWRIATDAAGFFFSAGDLWTSLTEVPLKDGEDRAAGNIDVVLVSYNDDGQIVDFGALEVQAVYISGNVRRPFTRYMEVRLTDEPIDWTRSKLYPNPDFLSSSRKRLAPQLLYKGTILNIWGKKQAVAVQKAFWQTLPRDIERLDEGDRDEADLAWFIYDLRPDDPMTVYRLELEEVVYTRFARAMERITTPRVGPSEPFLQDLQDRLDVSLGELPPETQLLGAESEPDRVDALLSAEDLLGEGDEE